MPLLRRRPVLRAAAIGGGAYYMGKRRHESQQRETEEQAQARRLESQPSAPSTAGGMSPDAIDRLEQLGRLHEQGVLTDEEFAQQKAALLG